jgi:flagellar basal body-associated protein FliL
MRLIPKKKKRKRGLFVAMLVFFFFTGVRTEYMFVWFSKKKGNRKRGDEKQ